MKTRNISAADRKAIEVLLLDNYTPKQIGLRLGFHKSTICREIKNRRTPKGYFADIAQLNYKTKQQSSRKKKKYTNCYRLEKRKEVVGREEKHTNQRYPIGLVYIQDQK
jgi:IS30 family transposase